MTMIRSSRVILHSDFIDVNAVAKEITKEVKEKKFGALSRAIGNSRQQAPKPQKTQLSPNAKSKESLLKAKEREAYERYFKERELRVEKMAQQRGKSMLAGL